MNFDKRYESAPDKQTGCALPEDSPEIAAMRRAELDAETLRVELGLLADQLHIDRQNATRVFNAVFGALWYRTDESRAIHHVTDLYKRRRHFLPMRRASRGWQLLSAWLRARGFVVPSDPNPAPRCIECGRVLPRKRKA